MTDGQRLATELVLLVRDPVDGSLRGRNVDVCLRAALLCQLALDGHIVSVKGAPVASAAQIDDAILGALHSAIRGRPRVAWRRWFRHVRVDREALVDELVASARLTSVGTDRFTDAQPERTRALRNRLLELESDPSQARTGPEAVLGYLFVLAQSRLVARDWDDVLGRAVVGMAPPTAGTVLMVLRSAGQVLARRRLLRQ